MRSNGNALKNVSFIVVRALFCCVIYAYFITSIKLTHEHFMFVVTFVPFVFFCCKSLRSRLEFEKGAVKIEYYILSKFSLTWLI